MPNDNANSLSSFMGAAGAAAGLLGVLFGGKQSIDVDLDIARSEAVALEVTRQLHDVPEFVGKPSSKTVLYLRHHCSIETVRGSIVKIDCLLHDKGLGLRITRAYVSAIRDRLSTLNKAQAIERKTIAESRLDDASVGLARAQHALGEFRQENKLAAPEIELGATSSQIATLQGQLQAEQTNLETLLRFATSKNIEVEAARARIAALTTQIFDARSRPNGTAMGTVNALTPKLTKYEDLFRDERYWEASYEIYKRYLETVTVDELSARINLDVIEPPYISPARQFNTRFIGLFIFILLSLAFAEFYLLPAGPRRGS